MLIVYNVLIIVAIECMGTACYVLADEDFILSLLANSSLRDKYQKYTFSDHVKVSTLQCLILSSVAFGYHFPV